MTDFSKYLKYKTKYLNLNGGGGLPSELSKSGFPHLPDSLSDIIGSNLENNITFMYNGKEYKIGLYTPMDKIHDVFVKLNKLFKLKSFDIGNDQFKLIFNTNQPYIDILLEGDSIYGKPYNQSTYDFLLKFFSHQTVDTLSNQNVDTLSNPKVVTLFNLLSLKKEVKGEKEGEKEFKLDITKINKCEMSNIYK